MPTVPSVAPLVATQGDTLTWYQDGGAYTPADGWTLSVHLLGVPGVTPTVAVEDGRWRVTIGATASPGIPVGLVRWIARVSRAGEVFTIAEGAWTMRPAPAAAPVQSFAARMVAAIEARLQGRLTQDLESYGEAGRQVQRIPFEQLERSHARYLRLLEAERAGGAPPPLDYVLYASA